jgi:hypothetical protein
MPKALKYKLCRMIISFTFKLFKYLTSSGWFWQKFGHLVHTLIAIDRSHSDNESEKGSVIDRFVS